MKQKDLTNKIVHLDSMGWCIVEDHKTDGITFTPLDKDRAYTVLKKTTNNRTIKQNASMWKYLSLLANALNDAGLSIQKVMKWDLVWSKDTAKQFLWDIIMKAITQKTSSTKLASNELTKIHRYLDLKMQEKGIEHIPFPSEESMIFEQNYKDYR